MTPENIHLYLEDLEELIELLGNDTLIKVGNVKYKTIEEFQKKHKNKTLKGLRLQNSNGEYINISEHGYVDINTNDTVTKVVISTFLFSKQEKVNNFIERILFVISKIASALVLLLSLFLLLHSESKEMTFKILSIGILAIFFFQILPMVSISLPRRNYINCRTSDDTRKFWETETFKGVIITVAGGVIILAIQYILMLFGIKLF